MAECTPATDSSGQRIHPTDEGIRNFGRRFNGVQPKRVVGKDGQGDNGRENRGVDNGTAGSWTSDNRGRPRVFYYGTAGDFSTFDLYHQNCKDQGRLGRDVYAPSSTPLPKVCQLERWIQQSEEHYMPPHPGEVSRNIAHPIGQGFNIRSRETKRATGFKREITSYWRMGHAA